MTGQVAFEAITNVRDDLITEAAELLGFLDEPAPLAAKPPREYRENLFSRFFNSGWGVAVICAVVSLSVLGGIIWAGQRPPAGGPGNNPSTETNTDAFETEPETVQYIGEDQTDIWIKCGGETVYPREFFVWSGPADGLGFFETVQGGQAPALPVARFYLMSYDGTGEIFLPDGYEVKRITLYDQNMTDITDEKMNLLLLSELDAFMSMLLPGRYYLSLYVEKQPENGETIGCDYALEIQVQNSAQDIQPGHEANDYQRTWVALRDKIRSAGEPYKSVSSHSGLDLPIYETGIRKWYESRTGDYMVMMGVDMHGNVVMAFDHYKALVVLSLGTDGNMAIRVRSEGNYHCAQTVTPPATISNNFWFKDKNEWYSSTESHEAPLYYLVKSMAQLDEVMGELGEEFSFEALGYVYAK